MDNTECQKMVDRAKLYGCENVGFILNRGYFCINNIRYFEKNAYDYVLMTKGSTAFTRDAIEECIAVLKGGYKSFISEYELFGKTIIKISLIQMLSSIFMYIMMVLKRKKRK